MFYHSWKLVIYNEAVMCCIYKVWKCLNQGKLVVVGQSSSSSVGAVIGSEMGAGLVIERTCWDKMGAGLVIEWTSCVCPVLTPLSVCFSRSRSPSQKEAHPRRRLIWRLNSSPSPSNQLALALQLFVLSLFPALNRIYPYLSDAV